MTLPSFFAASIKAGVTAPTAAQPPLRASSRLTNENGAGAASTSRREIPGRIMWSFPALLAKLGTPEPAALFR